MPSSARFEKNEKWRMWASALRTAHRWMHHLDWPNLVPSKTVLGRWRGQEKTGISQEPPCEDAIPWANIES